MPEYTRVLDLDTGHESSIQTTALAHGNYRVLPGEAVDVAGEPLPAVYASVPGPVPTGDAPAGEYSSWKKPALEAEVEKRNDARGDEDQPVEVAGKGTVTDLVAALEADDARQAAAAAQNSGAATGAGLSTAPSGQ